MAAIHLLCGFMGFGKTTLAKKLAESLPAKHFAIDEVILDKFGRNPTNFQEAYQKADAFIWTETKKAVQNNVNVVLDYGFWNKDVRKLAHSKALDCSNNVVWHQLDCDLEVAKQRVLHRTQHDQNELFIDENCFNEKLAQYEPISDDEGYIVIHHKSE